jgi:hypothetical protein
MGSAWEQFQAYLDASGKDGTEDRLTLSQFVEASGRDVAVNNSKSRVLLEKQK